MARKKIGTITVGDAVSAAYSTIDELLGGLNDWYDSMPEGLKSSNTGETLEAAISGLSEMDGCEPDISDYVSEVRIDEYRQAKSSSRREQAEHAASMLYDAATAMTAAVETMKASHETMKEERAKKALDTGDVEDNDGDEELEERLEEVESEVTEAVTTLEEHASLLESIEWPRMFGG